MRQLLKFLKLSLAEKKLLTRAFLFLLSVRFGLFIFQFQGLIKIAARGVRNPSPIKQTSPVFLDKISWAVRTASRYLPGAESCLVQALAAQMLLKKNGFPSEFQIGVARSGDGRFYAHAWVQSFKKIIIGEDSLNQYKTIFALCTH